jgi:hypothetical protein
MYQIPMHEVAVTVALAGVEPEEHFVYLAPSAERREGPETMADYLNGGRRFFPMMSSGAAKMINRDHIVWVRFDRLPDDDAVTLVETLTILELTDGSRIEGVVPIHDRPREYARVSDVLNDPRESFMRIDDEGETYYVNKSFIRLVIPR